MDEPTRRKDLEVLGVGSDAEPTEIARAYRELRVLYAEDSLASYSLCAHEERTVLLGRIEEAYGRVACRPDDLSSPLKTPTAPSPAGPPAVDPARSPGAFLRLSREARGLSLRDVAEETKIGCRHLEHIEDEAFGDLPVRVYLRGFLIAYARALRLDNPKKTADLYLSKFESECTQAA